MSSNSSSSLDIDEFLDECDEDPYTDFLEEQILNRMEQARYPVERVPRPVRHRRYIRRDHAAAHIQLWGDYFSEYPRYPADVFRRRFRMSRQLFLHIVNSLSARYEFFQLKVDATGKPGLSPLQKCTVAIRQLAYGGSADMFDEYLQVGESTGVECLKNFCQGVRETFKDTYLRKPTTDDCQFLMDWHWNKHGFPGMLGSIDCMHWVWKNCPTAWRGQFTTGFKGTHPTVILEAVADQRLWIWHAYFGVAGSNNDLNVLQSSPLFNKQIDGLGPAVQFTANGNVHTMGYYLADGIYPQWPVFLKTIRCPTDEKRKHFARMQEAARKDVERAFGVLQSRFALVKGGARFYYLGDLSDIMYSCIIMHNMIIGQEGAGVEDVATESVAGPSHGFATESTRMGVPYNEHERFAALVQTRQRERHRDLQRDMIEEVWANRNRARRG